MLIFGKNMGKSMKERGISFNTEMVRAILDGSKTQTRRVIKPQPNQVFENIAILYTPQDEELGRLGKVLNCQYGEIGDRLWVKESHGETCIPQSKMPRCASRIIIEITGVRVERLQDISRGDCMSEGCPFQNIAKETDPVQWYKELWESIYGAGSWDTNPFVWVIEFKRIEDKT